MILDSILSSNKNLYDANEIQFKVQYKRKEIFSYRQFLTGGTLSIGQIIEERACP